MRFIALPITVMAALLLYVAPASAQSVTLSAAIVNAVGPVTTCPITLTFTGTIAASNWSPTQLRQIQYKWTRSDGADSETQTLTFPAGSTSQTVSTPWQLSAPGTNWEALSVSYPPIANPTSNQAQFNLTCPTPGSLTKPGTRPVLQRSL